MCCRICLHFFYFFFAQSAWRSNTNRLFLVCRFILCGNMKHTVCIDIECDFDLRNTARCRRNTIQMKLTERAVIYSHWALTLQNVNLYRGLAVRCRRIYFAFLRRYCCVRLNHLCHYTTKCLDTKCQRRYVEKQHICYITWKNAPLNRCAYCNNFVRIHTLMSFFSEYILHQLLNTRHTRHSTDENNLVNLTRIKSCIFQCLFYWWHATLD